MKRITLIALICCQFALGQSDLQFTSKDSIIQSSWILGLGYNFVDDSGDVFDNIFAIESQWNALPYPNRISIGKYFKSGLGIEAIGSYNEYKKGKIIDQLINENDTRYVAVDTRLSYDLNKLIGQTSWFDPYVGVGLGYTDANNEPRGTYNAVVGFRTWFSDRIGLDFSSSGKWRIDNNGTNHIQHAAGIVYQFGIEKGLSKRGKEKELLAQALEEEKQCVNDSIAKADSAREAELLAERLAAEKEKARVDAIAETKAKAENQRKQQIEKAINDLGFVYFDLNSSYLNKDSKMILTKLATVLKQNPTVELQVDSHTDSRGQSAYNKWLSQRRVNRTVLFLVELGIDPTRLNSEAYGEDNLLNDCDNDTFCPEEKHKVNRRSEFKIVKY